MMLATQSLSMSTRTMKSNYLKALNECDSSSHGMPSPESHADGGFTIEMSDLMLPASALESELFGIPPESSATVVSTGSSDESQDSSLPSEITTSKRSKRKSSSAASERRHSVPSTLLLTQSALGEAVTQPVPEFLCHLFSMLRDPSYIDMISWEVPAEDEPDHQGGGIAGIGKIVVHKPEDLQEIVLGRYYRHSKYASFQRQLNYFGFKKRLHGGKKGKLSPCSYIHESLNEDVGSLFSLKRRPPAKKRALENSCDNDCAASVSSAEDRSVSTKSTTSSSKRRRVTIEKKSSKKSKKDISSKKDKKKQQKENRQQGKQQVAITSMPIKVQAQECVAPTPQTSAAIQNNQFKMRIAPSMIKPMSQISRPAAMTASKPVTPQPQQVASQPEAQPTLLELLSTSLPDAEILFNDEVDSVDDDGIPAWVTDDGKYHYHNVDSSLVDLAMLY